MTTATFPFRRARLTAAAAGLAAALALTGCSGDDGSEATPTTAGPSATAGTGTDGGGTGGGSGGTSSAGGDLSGSWLTTAGGKAVVLMVNGGQAGLFATGGTMCSGTTAEKSGTRTIRLTCTDGSKDRAVGTVDSVAGRTLHVTWRGALGEETYTKSEGGKLPTGLPTASLGLGS
ncbi:hypothetical protein [Streptomyces sp. NBC_00198]|uniref:hypothetical protein n=1 Tax=Streptomyces sp. NBC_00198 TaxID=2975677 RepID=UPI002259D891|nr:hypothetical protein [Streptomyces sp. NBC_00198]MCX5284717.1 hypothetical protein [Streptomyces sp. NBC_00198]